MESQICLSAFREVFVCACVRACMCFTWEPRSGRAGSVAFHLPFLQVASVRLVRATSFLADNTWGSHPTFPTCQNIPFVSRKHNCQLVNMCMPTTVN